MPATVLECPGFLDLQVNGFAGVDFNDPGLQPDAIDRALEGFANRSFVVDDQDLCHGQVCGL